MAGPAPGGRADGGRTYDELADLPVRVEGWSLEGHERETSAGSARRTTVFAARGGDHVGRGEDVTYDADEHDVLSADPPDIGLEGEHTLAAASRALDGVDLFPAGAPDRDVFRQYRRWAAESALLDLALRQAGMDLPTALNRAPEPVRFVVSPKLGDPPTAEPVERWLDVDPDLEFKLDATAPWSDDVLDSLVETGQVRTIDLKAHYPASDGGGSEGDDRQDRDEVGEPGGEEGDEADDTDDDWRGRVDPEPGFYRRLLDAFPEAVFEDPAVTDATRPVLEPAADRLAWDAPIHAVDEFEAQPLAVGHCNVKPSRFGTLERLLDFLDFAREEGLRLYGGGQFELAVGRGQLHALASLFYAEGPNDVAPRGYNDPVPRAGLPSSPLAVPDPEPGFGWRRD